MQILNFTEVPNDQFVLATFDIYLGDKSGMTLRKYKLCRSKKGHMYLGRPSYKETAPDGSNVWKPYVEFTEDRNKDFSASVFEALKPFLRA